VAGENEAKRGAPWTDRTSNARNSIKGEAEADSNAVTAYLSIGMYYGVFLELCNGGKYRIVLPTIQWMQTQLSKYLTL
jgi:hypothetical protein